ncbi:MAG TPA: alpha-1,2-fucosyltransferase [Gallionellaceae bacterium]
MFQYAAGRALALRRQTVLRLDISGFAKYHLHQGFELKRVFDCQAELASAAETRALLGWQSVPVVRRILAKPAFAALRRSAWVVEPHFNYWPGLRSAPDNCYLVGYWQSEKYFKECEATIRSEFTFRQRLDARNAELADEIGRTSAVSLHVRRGDYARNPRALVTHGLCSLDYYRAAINYVAERVESPEFFIFSDDISWAQKNLDMTFPCRFIDHNQGAQSFVDMQLMSLCRHHIIANSSFSWWGAWLNSSPQKIVIAPQSWFANGRAVDDLIPESWVRL